MSKILSKLFLVLAILFLIFSLILFLPLILLNLRYYDQIFGQIQALPQSQLVVVFGTKVDPSQEASPLLKERLESGVEILKQNKAQKIIVSNMPEAAKFMSDYLIEKQVPKEKISLDTNALTTADTCRNQELKNNSQSKIFISQGYHLSRILYQCSKLGVTGIAYRAENINVIDKSEYALFIKLKTRVIRSTREAILIWASILNIYK